MILPLSPPPSYNCIISPPSPKGDSIKIVGFDFSFFFSPSPLKSNPCPLFDVKVVRFGTAETSSFHPPLKRQPSLRALPRAGNPIRQPSNPLYLTQAGASPPLPCVSHGAGWGARGWGPLRQLQSWERFPPTPKKSGILQQELTEPHEQREIARPQLRNLIFSLHLLFSLQCLFFFTRLVFSALFL